MSSVGWTRGHWMQTFTGRQFFPLDPQPEDIDARDIAHALSLICRYGGHTVAFYSVAEHCLLMSRAVAPEHALWALLHDAAEAYVGDMVRPLKHHMPEYRAIEDNVLSTIAQQFGMGFTADFPDAVKEADNRILLDERSALFGGTPAPWAIEDLEPLGVPISGLSPEEAESMYLDRLYRIWDGQATT